MDGVNNLIEMILDEDSEVFAISVVESPAIESDFLALSNSKTLLKVQDQDKRILSGAILIPNLPILRINDKGEEYHIFFSDATVNELSQRFLKNQNQSEVTMEHAVKVDDVTLVESWIKTDNVNDKSVKLGLDVPVGSWLGTMKVDNDDLWNNFIKTGHLKGFSVEALLKPKTNSNLNINKMSENKDKTILDQIKELFASEKPDIIKEEKIDLSEYVKLEFVESKFTDLEKKIKTLESTISDMTSKLEVKEEEVQEEIKAETKEVEETVKEEAEVIAMTDNTGEVNFSSHTPFEYKLTVSERIAKSLMNNN